LGKFASWAVTRSERSYSRMLEYGWCWWYARMWWRDPRNRRHMRLLEQRRRSRPGGTLENGRGHVHENKAAEHAKDRLPPPDGLVVRKTLFPFWSSRCPTQSSFSSSARSA